MSMAIFNSFLYVYQAGYLVLHEGFGSQTMSPRLLREVGPIGP